MSRNKTKKAHHLYIRRFGLIFYILSIIKILPIKDALSLSVPYLFGG